MADNDSCYQQQTEGGIGDKPPPAYNINAMPAHDSVEGIEQPFIQQPVMQPQPLQQHPANAPHMVIMQPQPFQQHIANAPHIVIVPSTQPQGVQVQVQPPEPYDDLTCLSCLVCLLCNWCCGIFALIFADNAQNAYRRGDYVEYRRQRNNAKTCIGISFCFGIVCLLAGIARMSQKKK
eukprot:35451_1